MGQALRVLIVEDAADDVLLLLRELRRGGFEPTHLQVDQVETMQAALLEQQWDVILADYVMPTFTGLDALGLTKCLGLDLPFIMVSGKMGEEWAVEAMKAGAHDYIVKNNLVRLVPAINREIQETARRREAIAQRQRAEQKVQRYQQQLRSLAAELSLIEERERRRLATDLHDQIGQSLALAKIKLGALGQQMGDSQWGDDLQDIRELVKEAIRYTRSLTFELSPPLLYELDLHATLEWLCERFQDRWGISFCFSCDGAPKSVSQETCVLLYKVIRELFLNIVKHAQATQAQLRMTSQGERLIVVVEDDGIGFVPPEGGFHQMASFGLFSIHERLSYLGGAIQVTAGATGGTRVILELPATSVNQWGEKNYENHHS